MENDELIDELDMSDPDDEYEQSSDDGELRGTEKDRLIILHQRQAMPLDFKIKFSLKRIAAFIDEMENQGFGAYVSFSGGKDSTVLLDLCRRVDPEIPAVFSDTGLEYPEIREFVKTIPNVTWVKPERTFRQVCEEVGYPVGSKKIASGICKLQNPTDRNVISRQIFLYGVGGKGQNLKKFRLPQRWLRFVDSKWKISDGCCYELKKKPLHDYDKISKRKPIIGTMACEGSAREKAWLKTGCNTTTGQIKSRPISFWMEKDIWDYIHQNNLPYSSVYDSGVHRTGCMFCMFGVHMEGTPNRFEMMKKTHPTQYDYCINKLGLGEILDFMYVPY